MNLEESRKQVELIRVYAHQMAHENKQRNTILHELLDKGYEKREAVMLLNLIQKDADKLIAEKKKPRVLLIGAINGFFIGGAMCAFSGLYWWKSSIIFFGLMLTGAGLFLWSIGTFILLIYRKWNGKRNGAEADSLDNLKKL